MGTLKTYSLFTISQENKFDEIYDCGKCDEKKLTNAFDLAKNN
jgi:hypothetical protein